MNAPEESSFGTPPCCVFDAATGRVEQLMQAIARNPPLIEVHLRGTREEWAPQKSLWLVQTARELRELAYLVACVDLTSFGTHLSEEALFALLAEKLANQLQVSLSFPPAEDIKRGRGDLTAIWLGEEGPAATWDPRRSAVANFDRFVSELLRNLPKARLVIFLDELDVVLSAVSGTWGNALCGWIRSWQNGAPYRRGRQSADATLILMRSS